MSFKIMVETTHDDGQVTEAVYTGNSFLVAVPNNDVTFVGGEISSLNAFVSLVSLASKIMNTVITDPGYNVDDIVAAEKIGSSVCISRILGNNCDSCDDAGTCLSMARKNVQGGTH